MELIMATIQYTPPKVIFSLDGEFGATEPDSVVFDTGIVAFVLNEDGITYNVAGWWHHLNGFNTVQEDRIKTRSTMDWWLFDARSSYKPSPDAVAYLTVEKRPGNCRVEMMHHANFVQDILDRYQVDRTNWVVCAKGPDTDCLIYNHRFAQLGFEFNYRFARFASMRDLEPAVSVFNRVGMRAGDSLRENCPIPFAPANWYSSGDYKTYAKEDQPWKGMPPAVEHVGLYDAWIEGCDAVEYYTIMNALYHGKAKIITV